MSNRFHNKWHRASHHTYKDPTIIDAGWDPIASPNSPFQGDFVLADGSGGTQIGELYSKIIHTTKLTPDSPEGQDWNADKILVDTNLEVTKNITGDVDLYVKRNTSGHGWLKIDSYGDFGGYLHSVGNISGDSQLFITGDGTFGGNVNITGNETVKGNFNLTGNANINGSISGHSWLKIDQYGHFVGDVSGDSNLYVTGYGHIGEYVHIYGDDGTAGAYGLIVDNNSHFVGSADIDSNLNVDGYTYINGQDTPDGWGLKVDKKLNVNGKTVLNDQLDVLGTNNNNISGNIRLKGNLSADDYIRTTNNLDVSGDGHIVKNLQVDGYVHINGDPSDAAGHALVVPDLYVTQHLSAVSATFHNIDITASEGRGFVVTGYAPSETVPVDYFEVPTTSFIHGDKNVYLDKVGLFVDGWTVLSGDTLLYRKLNVSGDSTFVNTYTTGTATIKTLSVTGDSDLDGNLDVGGTLTVTGDTTLNSKLNVSGETALKNTSIGGTLSVTGATTLNSTLNVSGNTNTKGLTADGDVSVKTLNVTGGDTKVKNLTAENTYINGTFETTGNSTFVDTYTTGVATVKDLSVTGDSIFKDVLINGDVTIGSRAENSTSGAHSFAAGSSVDAKGQYSFAIGDRTSAYGNYSQAQGDKTYAYGNDSHAEGTLASAIGGGSHADGGWTIASGLQSHSEGLYTTAYGNGSHVEGWHTTTTNEYEHAAGTYNVSNNVPDSTFPNAGNTLSSIGFGTDNSHRKNAVEVMQDGKVFIAGIGSYNGTNPTAQTTSDLATVVNGKINSMIEKTWAQLKSMRDDNSGSGSLVPGQWYRITDYVATTVQEDTQSANHPFDIIVRADSTNKLNENAYAIKNAEDTTYFVNSKLEAWQVWYCLDNDTNRFAWADSANGRGVVYRLIDEFNNDCPYDFKGIKMKAYGDTDNVYRYTFDSGDASNNTDYSLSGGTRNVNNNVIGRCLVSNKHQLNRIVFKGRDCYSNTFKYNCRSNTFGSYCYSNTFGDNCNSNTFGDNCNSNTFDTGCSSNTFGEFCSSNTFGDNCSSNIFDDNCSMNTFGCFCSSNTFGFNCRTNRLGESCDTNRLDKSCGSNTFGDNCSYNTLGGSFSHNTLGNGCVKIVFGYKPSDFSSTVSYEVGDVCRRFYQTYRCTVAHTGSWNESHFVMDPLSAARAFYQFVTFENGVSYVFLDCTATRTGTELYSNVTVSKGILGTDAQPKVIQDANKSQSFKTTYTPANSQVISV